MTLVSRNIWYMQIFEGVPLGKGVVDNATTAISGDLGGYFVGSFRNKDSNIIWRYATPYLRRLSDC